MTKRGHLGYRWTQNVPRIRSVLSHIALSQLGAKWHGGAPHAGSRMGK